MVFSLSHVLLPLALRSVAGLDNGLGRTPAMGFNAWNRFRCKKTDRICHALEYPVALLRGRETLYVSIGTLVAHRSLL
jgi:hypothetical protein